MRLKVQNINLDIISVGGLYTVVQLPNFKVAIDMGICPRSAFNKGHVFFTHTHADHITGCFTIAESVGCDYVMWHSTPSLGVTKYVDEQSQLQLGNEKISFYHVPGHTEDSMLVVTSNHVFTGDFLFTGDGGVGRDDLPSGRMRAHFDSLKVMSLLSGDLLVCTGHEAPGVEFQTLSWNRLHNPVLKMSNYSEYVEWQNNTTAQLGYVSKIKVALPANLFGEIPEEIPWL